MDDSLKRREMAEKRKAKYTQIVVTKDVKAMIDKLCEKSFRSAAGEVSYQIARALERTKELPYD